MVIFPLQRTLRKPPQESHPARASTEFPQPFDEDDDLKPWPAIIEGRTPSPPSQLTLSLTGAISGASTVPIEFLWPHATSIDRLKEPIPKAFNWAFARR